MHAAELRLKLDDQMGPTWPPPIFFSFSMFLVKLIKELDILGIGLILNFASIMTKYYHDI
jgi:hypothetical protein